MANNLSTNLSLQKPIDESILVNDFENLQAANAASLDIIEKALAGVQSAATTGVNASVINTNGNRIVQCQLLSNGCISSITGMITGMPFTLVIQSSGSMGIADVGVFKTAGVFVGAVNSTISLVWDGTHYQELGRSANGA